MARAAVRLVLAVMIALVLAASSAQADSARGSAVGVDAFYVSAGAWDAFWLDHDGGSARLVLSWSASILGADLDLTVFRPGSLDDGVLSQDEVVAYSWTYGGDHREESVAVELDPGRYVVTVEPIRAQGERYVLEANGGLAVASTLTPGVKLHL